MGKEKRRTKTSSAVKNRYNAKVYKSVMIMADKELVERFKEKCRATGIAQAQVFKKAMEEFLASE